MVKVCGSIDSTSVTRSGHALVHVKARRASIVRDLRSGAATSRVPLGAVCLLIGMVLGCGQRGPVVEMVEGVVLLDGQPVEGATVLFSPDAGGAADGLPAVGRTD